MNFYDLLNRHKITVNFVTALKDLNRASRCSLQPEARMRLWLILVVFMRPVDIEVTESLHRHRPLLGQD